MTEPLHTTTDWYTAAFLVSQGVPLAASRRVGPKKVEFSFHAGERLHGLLRRYRSGEPVVLVPGELFAAHRRLKSRSPLAARH